MQLLHPALLPSLALGLVMLAGPEAGAQVCPNVAEDTDIVAGEDNSGTDHSCHNHAFQGLPDTNLSGSLLGESSFEVSNLSGSILSGVDATDAIFRSADLENLIAECLSNNETPCASLGGSTATTCAVFDGANFEFAVAREANFEGACFRAGTLPANLFGVQLDLSDLDDTDFTGADLSFSRLRGTSFDGAILEGADLEQANVSYAVLPTGDPDVLRRIRSSFVDADLSSADGSGICPAPAANGKLDWIDLTGAILTRADLRCATLTNANLSLTTLPCGGSGCAQFDDVDLSYATYSGSDFEGVSFDDAILFASRASCAINVIDPEDTKDDEPEIVCTSFLDGSLARVDLTQAEWLQVKLCPDEDDPEGTPCTDLTDAIVSDVTNPGDADAGGIRSAQLSQIDFSPYAIEAAANPGTPVGLQAIENQNLAGVDFTGSNFSGLDLTGLDLRHATLSNVNLTCTIFEELDPPDFSFATLDNLQVVDLCAEDGCSNNAPDCVDFSGVTLTGVSMQTSFFQGISFKGTIFDQVNFSGSFFSNVDFGVADGENPVEFTGTILDGVTIDCDTSNNAVGVCSFENAIFFGGFDLDGDPIITSMQRVGLDTADREIFQDIATVDGLGVNPDLRFVDFSNARISNLNFTAVDFTGADLTGALIKNSVFDNAIFSDASTVGTATYTASLDLTGGACTEEDPNDCVSASFVRAHLVDVELRGALLQGASFIQANLEGADFSCFDDSDQICSDLSGAILPGASFVSADLSNALLDGAELTSTDCSPAPGQGLDCDIDLDGALIEAVGMAGVSFDEVSPDFFDAVAEALDDDDQPTGLRNLRRMGFAQAVVGHLDMVGYDLSEADFSQAVLCNDNDECVDWTGSLLTGINLSGVFYDGDLFDFDGVDLSEATLDAETLCPSGSGNSCGSFVGTILDDASIQGVDFTNLDNSFSSDFFTELTSATGLDLSNSDLSGFDLAGVDLSDADLSFTNLTNVDFDSISGTTVVVGAILEGANLSNADLTELATDDGEGGKTLDIGRDANNQRRLSGATLVNADFSSTTTPSLNLAASCREVNDDGDICTPVEVLAGDCEREIWGGFDFATANLSGTNFSNALMRGAQLTSLTTADICNNDTGTERCLDFSQVDFRGEPEEPIELGCPAIRTSFRSSNFTSGEVPRDLFQNLVGNSLSYVDLTGASFYREDSNDPPLDLSGIDFSNMQALFSPDTFCDSASTDFSDMSCANLSGADFSDSFLIAVTFSTAEIGDVNFQNADVTGSSFNHMTAGDLCTDPGQGACAVLENALLEAVEIKNTNLAGLDPSFFAIENIAKTEDDDENPHHFNLRSVDFSFSDLEEIQLTCQWALTDLAENLPGCSEDFDRSCEVTPSGPGGCYEQVYFDLTNTTYTGTNLTCADLSGSAIENVARALCGENPLDQETDCADLTRADLSGTEIQLSDWSFVDFTDVPLTGANLSYTALEGATFVDVQNPCANPPVAACNSDFECLDFTGADLRRVNMLEMDFTQFTSGIDFAGRTLTEANFTGSNFAGMDLGESRFLRSLLTNTNLSNTDMTNADFRGTDFSGGSTTNPNGSCEVAADNIKTDLRGAYLGAADFSDAESFAKGCIEIDATTIYTIETEFPVGFDLRSQMTLPEPGAALMQLASLGVISLLARRRAR